MSDEPGEREQSMVLLVEMNTQPEMVDIDKGVGITGRLLPLRFKISLIDENQKTLLTERLASAGLVIQNLVVE